MKTHRALLVTILATFTLLAPGLQPKASASVSCTRYVNAVWTNTTGRLVLNSRPTATSTSARVWNLCDMHQTGNRIAPEVCQIFYTDFLVGLTAELPVTITFNDSVLTSEGLWAGTCDSITNWANVENAISSIQVGL